MADQQPGDLTRAAGPADEDTPHVGRTPIELEPTDPSTVPAPVRWSGSAAVRPPIPRRPWWSRRRAAERVGSASDDPTDWATTPPVDPWASCDTPWDPMTAVPEALPPTPLHPTLPGPSVPAPDAPARRRRWGRRREKRAGAAPTIQPPAGWDAARTGRPPRSGPTAAPPGWPAWRLPPGGPPPRPPAWRPSTPVAPPLGRPAAPPGPARPARRRRWPRRLALVTLFGVVCCCGLPGAFLAWAPARQYPVTAVLPHTVADLTLRDDSASRRAVARLTQQLRDANAPYDAVFAGVYGDGSGKRVTVFGTTGLHLTPKADVEAEVRRLAADYALRDVRPYDLGETGVHERCGVGTAGGSTVVVCAWADHGSLATVVADRRSVPDSAELTGIFRSAVLTHG